MKDRLKGLHDLSESEADSAVRKELFCRGCGGTKDYGCVVCWACFKGGNDGYRSRGIESLKYFDGSFKQYLAHLDATGQKVTQCT